jgi:lipopolysaccharide/colanic/teichoic acid biosynthesis glycosyltransferase/acetyltransferase-like isoleucine patch superfamily enzyme
MRAVLYTGGRQPWAEALGEHPWALLPVAGRPLLSYWLELCVDLGIRDVQIVLGYDAEYVELFCGNGEKWGLSVSYSLIREEDHPLTYLSRDPERWESGLLYIGGAFFPRRLADFSPSRLPSLLDGCCVRHHGYPVFFISRDMDRIHTLIRHGLEFHDEARSEFCENSGSCNTMSGVALEPTFFDDIAAYYRLNMEIVRGEMSRYLSGGYSTVDGASIGYNVITPLSVTLTPPLAIGNDCRIGAISSIGPDAVISDHVLIDRQCELSDCIILSDTYVGRNLEIKGKIVVGNRIIDPEDGAWLDIEDPWLVASTRSRNRMRDIVRAAFGWQFALVLVLLQVLPFCLFYLVIRLLRRGRFVPWEIRGIGGNAMTVPAFRASSSAPSFLVMSFCAVSLDRFPQLLRVLTGRLWLCGQVPKELRAGEINEPHRYFPAVFSYSDAFVEIDKQMDALYYAHTRSLAADLRILRHALFARLVEVEIISAASAPAL